jgi:hypothetical protein
MKNAIILDAPWTNDQVDSLNAYQKSGKSEPFTGDKRILIATPNGWVEENTKKVVQTWTYQWAANWDWKTLTGPRRTEKPPESASFDGVLIPCDNDRLPLVFAEPSSQDIYLACFTTAKKLKETLEKGRFSYKKVVQVKDGHDLAKSVPHYLKSRRIKIILDPYYTKEGKMRFSILDRPSIE